jgi:hypothetical protein
MKNMPSRKRVGRRNSFLADPAYEGRTTTNREYVIESIMLPEVFIVPGEWHNPNPMPTDFHERMSDTDLADILGWLNTFE